MRRAAHRRASSSVSSCPARASSPSSCRCSAPSGSSRPQRPGLRQHAGAAFGAGQVAVLRGLAQQLPRQRHGLLDGLLEGLGAEFAHEAVRVVLGRQEQEAHLRRSVACGSAASRARPAARRPAASPSKLNTTASVKRNSFCTCSAVQAVPSVATALPKPTGPAPPRPCSLRRRARGRARGSPAGLEQAVELAPLAEHRCLGRVQVLGLAVVEHAAAEADHLAPTARIGNITRCAEPVVALAIFVGVGLVALLRTRPASSSSGSS
jgi:hypothetical protein